MESEKMREARRDEVAYCGNYCRACYWYTDAMRRPASQLLELVKGHFEVGLWINEKGGNSQEVIRGSRFSRKAHVLSIARAAVAGVVVLFAIAVSGRASISVTNAAAFYRTLAFAGG